MKILLKIGIMTWYYGVNYGALAQSIAMYNTIKNLGYDCEMINYRPKNYIKTIVNSNLPKRREFYKIQRAISGVNKIRTLSKYEYFTETSKVNSAQDINKLGLDYIIFGSDAIFNLKHPMCDELFFGVDIEGNKIAYSPSCEYFDPHNQLPKSYVDALKEMKAISVRDRNTYELIRNNTGITPEITLDPTFLYGFLDLADRVYSGKYLLFYSFSTWEQYGKKVRTFAKENGLNIISIGQSVKWADISIENATFEQWISAFRDAEVVMTDSFHGTIFSLKNNKQIILCGRNDKLSKIYSLLAQLGVSIEIYNGTMIEEYLSQNVIDYDSTNELLEREIDRSLNYLVNALK